MQFSCLKSFAGWSSLVARKAQMDTKLKADIAESAVTTELLKRALGCYSL